MINYVVRLEANCPERGGCLTDAICSRGEISDILTPFISFFTVTFMANFNFFIDRDYFDFIKFIISSSIIPFLLLVFNQQIFVQKPFLGMRCAFRIIRHFEL